MQTLPFYIKVSIWNPALNLVHCNLGGIWVGIGQTVTLPIWNVFWKEHMIITNHHHPSSKSTMFFHSHPDPYPLSSLSLSFSSSLSMDSLKRSKYHQRLWRWKEDNKKHVHLVFKKVNSFENRTFCGNCNKWKSHWNSKNKTPYDHIGNTWHSEIRIIQLNLIMEYHGQVMWGHRIIHV